MNDYSSDPEEEMQNDLPDEDQDDDNNNYQDEDETTNNNQKKQDERSESNQPKNKKQNSRNPLNRLNNTRSPLSGKGINPTNMLGKGGIPGMSQSGGMGGKLAGRGAMLAGRGAVALFSTPVGWVILGVLLLIAIIILIFISVSGDGDTDEESGSQDIINEVTTPNTTVTVPSTCVANPALCNAANEKKSSNIPITGYLAQKNVTLSDTPRVLAATDSVPQSVYDSINNLINNIGAYEGSTIVYNIKASYPGQAEDIIVTDTISKDGIFAGASGICHIKTEGGNVSNVWWSFKENQGVNQDNFSNCSKSAPTTPTPTQSADTNQGSGQKVNVNKYWDSPYSLPQPTKSGRSYSATTIKNANQLGSYVYQYQSYLKTKYAANLVDPFLSVIWSVAIEGIDADTYFWNCRDRDKGRSAINKGCSDGYFSGGWQVGYGIQVSQAAGHLASDVKAVYGSSDASVVQRVGNAVIQGGGITYPRSMRALSVEQIVSQAGSSSLAQQEMAILLMDPKIGAVALAQEVAGDIGGGWANRMRGWGEWYRQNLDPSNPTFSNNIKSLAEVYTGSGSSGGGSGTTFSTIIFKSRVIPKIKNDLYQSIPVKVEVIGVKSSESNICKTAVGTVSGDKENEVGCEKSTSGGSSGGGGPAGPCQQAPAAPGDIRSAIISKWGITLNNFSQSQLQYAWKEFHQIDCKGILQDIRGTVVGIWNNAYAQQFSCPRDGGNNVMFSSQWGGSDWMAAILLHELTHVWQWCSNKGEKNRLEIPAARSQEGGLTNYSRTGCSFNVDLVNEDHADTIALYLNPNVGELTCAGGRGNPFSGGRYPAHRGVAERGTGK